MRIDRDGRWFYGGTPIDRPAMVQLFAGILHRVADGSYWLVTPAEQVRIEVDDVPFVAVELRSHGQGPQRTLEFRTNVDEWVRAGPEHPLHTRPTGEPPADVPICSSAAAWRRASRVRSTTNWWSWRSRSTATCWACGATAWPSPSAELAPSVTDAGG